MSKEKSRTFSGRAFTSVATALCFTALAITGVVLFITPPGRVAHWTGWRLGGLTKDGWSALHIWFALSFLIASGFHIWLNWQSLLSYFKSRVTRHLALRREWALALVLCIAIFAGTLVEIPPFSSLMALNDGLKNSWEKSGERAPIPHAERLSLHELASKVGVELETMMANLKASAIAVESSESLVGDLAHDHHLTPMQLYHIAIGKSGQEHGRPGGGGRGMGEGGGMGGGMGRKTLRQFCAEEGLDLTVSLERLRAAGMETDAGVTLRECAETAGIRPNELADILRTSDGPRP